MIVELYDVTGARGVVQRQADGRFSAIWGWFDITGVTNPELGAMIKVGWELALRFAASSVTGLKALLQPRAELVGLFQQLEPQRW